MPAVIVQRATLSPSSASRQTADLKMRSTSLRQTARGLTRNQTTAWSCDRGTVAQSAGGANRRGLDARRSGHADTLTAAGRTHQSLPEVSKQVSTQTASLTEPSGHQVHRGVESSLWCTSNWSDQMIVLIYGRTNMHFTSPKSSFWRSGIKTPTGQLGSRWKTAALNENDKKLERKFIEVQHLIRSDTLLTFPSSFLPKHPHSQGKLSFGWFYVVDIRVGWWNLPLHGGNLLFKT